MNIKACEADGWDNDKISASQPNYPLIESPSVSTPSAARNGGGTLFQWINESREWVCECGETCVPCSGDWRWNGRAWEHSHGYPIGHVAAERKP